MKISPVVGAPTIPNHTSTGLSPEKLTKLKAIAEGKKPEEEKQQEQVAPVISPQRSIKMKTSPTTDVVQEISDTTNVVQEETAISDAGVQTNATPEATEPLSPQFAALAKGRRALQQERMAFEKEKPALLAQAKADMEAKLKSNTLSVLQELGVTYDQLTNEILASQNGVTPEIQALRAELKALKEGVDKTLSDKDAATETAVLAEIRRNVNQMAESDDYELIRGTNSQKDVVDLIHRTYKKTGEVMSETEAMKLIEDELIEDSLKVARFKKVQAKLTPEPAPLQQQPQSGMKTLTNKDSARPVMGRRQRAILAMQGQLKG